MRWWHGPPAVTNSLTPLGGGWGGGEHEKHQRGRGWNKQRGERGGGERSISAEAKSVRGASVKNAHARAVEVTAFVIKDRRPASPAGSRSAVD